MAAVTPRILLVGRIAESDQCCQAWGCECRSAATYDEACRLLRTTQFDIVLSELYLPDGSAYRFVAALHGTRSSLFLAMPFEEGCIWLPAIERGRDCLGTAALWPMDFRTRLHDLLLASSASQAGRNSSGELRQRRRVAV